MCLREGRVVSPSHFKYPSAFRNSAASHRDYALHKERNRWRATVAAEDPASRMDKGMRVETRLQQGLQLGLVAQLVAQLTFNQLVVGSSPTGPIFVLDTRTPNMVEYAT